MDAITLEKVFGSDGSQFINLTGTLIEPIEKEPACATITLGPADAQGRLAVKLGEAATRFWYCYPTLIETRHAPLLNESEAPLKNMTFRQLESDS